MSTPTFIARWESRGGKHWVALYRDAFGYGYTAPDARGCLGVFKNDAEAIATFEPRVNDFQADRNVTPMHRTF